MIQVTALYGMVWHCMVFDDMVFDAMLCSVHRLSRVHVDHHHHHRRHEMTLSLELLNALDIPKHLQLNIMSKLSNASDPVKPLDTLGVDDVEALMVRLFPDEEKYARAISENRINGIVLTTINCKSPQGLSRLKDYGISSEIHAEVLRTYLSQWMQSGVPIRYLAVSHSSRSRSRSRSRSPMIAIKPEQSKSSSSGSGMPINHTNSRDNHSDQHFDVPVVSNPVEAAISHHEESRSVRGDAPLAAVARPIEMVELDGTSFGSTISLVFKPSKHAKCPHVSKHPNAALPINDSRSTGGGEQADASVGSEGGSDRCVETSTNKGSSDRCVEASNSKRKKDGLLQPASDRVVNKRHKPQVQLSDKRSAVAISRPNSRSSTTASALVHPSKGIIDSALVLTDNLSKGPSLRGSSSSSSRPRTSRVSVASSDGAPTSSADKAVSASSSSASSSSSRPSNVLYIAGHQVPSPDDLLDHRDNTKLQALSRLATLVKSEVREGWYHHHLDDDDDEDDYDDDYDDGNGDDGDDATATCSRCYCCRCYIL